MAHPHACDYDNLLLSEPPTMDELLVYLNPPAYCEISTEQQDDLINLPPPPPYHT